VSNIDFDIKQQIKKIQHHLEAQEYESWIKQKGITDWGLWKSGGTTCESQMSRIVRVSDEVGAIIEPYSDSGLSDYLSNVILIDDAVLRLSRHQKELMFCEFVPDYVEQITNHVFDYSERVRYWCNEFGIASPKTYRSTKSKSIKKVVEIILN